MSLLNVEIDYIGLQTNGQPLGSVTLPVGVVQQSKVVTWPEDRYLIGWAPWLGFGKLSELECHLMLLHNWTSVFIIGPHKECMSDYDRTTVSFFPSGTGRLVKKGEPVFLQLLATPTGSYAGIAANARIFSVKA